MKKIYFVFLVVFIFNINLFSGSNNFYISKECDIEHKKFRKYYDEYIYLIKNEQYSSGKRKFVYLKMSNKLVNALCPYDITKYSNDLFYSMKKINEGEFVKSQWGDKPLKSTRSNLSKNNIIQPTEEELEKIAKKKYKNTPNIYIEDIIIYNIQKISYFRNSKTKISIKGEEESYFFPINMIKKARLENFTKTFENKLNDLIKNAEK